MYKKNGCRIVDAFWEPPKLFSESPIWQEIHTMDLSELNTLHKVGPLTYQPYLYVIVRILKPRFLVETGVHNGVSTVFILKALEKNKEGELYSCDPLFVDSHNAKMHVRNCTGHQNFSSWFFFGEPSRKFMPKMVPHWDFFLHDSDHSEKNMQYELEFAWDRLSSNGILICDDIDWLQSNRIFYKFCESKGVSPQFFETAAMVIKN